MSNEHHAFEELRSILLSKDKEEFYRISEDLRSELISEIDAVKQHLEDPVLFSQKISASRSQIVDILGPVMGRMIKKYVQVEIEKLNQKLQAGTNKLTSAAYWKSVFSGKSFQNHTIIDEPVLQEVMIVSKDSGILVAKYSRDEMLDADMIAGMFTAIRSFMETALSANESDVGLIDYGEHKILIQDFGSFFFVFVFNGTNDAKFKQLLLESSSSFVEQNEIHLQSDVVYGDLSEELNHKLKPYFSDLCKK